MITNFSFYDSQLPCKTFDQIINSSGQNKEIISAKSISNSLARGQALLYCTLKLKLQVFHYRDNTGKLVESQAFEKSRVEKNVILPCTQSIPFFKQTSSHRKRISPKRETQHLKKCPFNK